ncbi:hypothetical protein DEGR_35510 (plasmid) [Deinococcus grandis]|nr:hypothetical protein DEGR_35510 [Deinococcus grandis]
MGPGQELDAARGRETLVSVQSAQPEPRGSRQASVRVQGECDEVQESVSGSLEQSGPVLALVWAQQQAGAGFRSLVQRSVSLPESR